MARRRIVVLLLVTFALVALFYGPLFAWAPITPGFTRTKSGDLTFLHRRRSPPSEAALRSAVEVPSLERQLGLALHGPVTIVLCDEWRDVNRFMPWLPSPRTLGARTLELGTVVYLTPLIRERADIGSFIRHELVHVLLLRNTSWFARAQLTRHWWIVEGLSVAYGNPDSYQVSPQRAEALRPHLARILDPDVEVDTAQDATVLERYGLAGAFVKYLERTYGVERFRTFLYAYLQRPKDWRRSFEIAFGTSFTIAVAELRL